MSSTLPPLVDEGALTDYLAKNLPGEDGALSISRHQAGHSNETFFVEWAGRNFVLRRPPLGAFLPTAHDVMREHTVLSALNDFAVRTPRTILSCEDESVIGAPFYLMERVHGVVIRTELPGSYSSDDCAAIGDELVDALVELHAVDYEECGLSSLAKTSGYLERQLRRWGGQLELTLPHTRPLPDLQNVGKWLGKHRPESPATSIVHGDYKLDNVVFSTEPPTRLLAILDWEMSTLGDPFADLGWMISFWREASDADQGVFADLNRVTTLPGFQNRRQLIDRYVDRSGRVIDSLDWYVVLAVWKLAILLEGSYARHLAGMTDDPFFARMEQGVPDLAARALDIIEDNNGL